MSPDALYLREACRVAVEESTDPHTQNGAFLRTKSGYFAAAANQLPPIEALPERFERPLKYSFIEHAERNVIYQAARKGIATHNATLYCPWFACTDCARAIILAGISRVVGHAKARVLTPERWRESVALADQMFQEAGVEIALLEDVLGVRYRFNDEWLDL